MHWQYSRKAGCTLLCCLTAVILHAAVLTCLVCSATSCSCRDCGLLLTRHSGQLEQQLAYMPNSNAKLPQHCCMLRLMHVFVAGTIIAVLLLLLLLLCAGSSSVQVQQCTGHPAAVKEHR